jgi:glycosyltransferase involved in cell wall biosynthesis
VNGAPPPAGERRPALLYSPNLQGHRITYCRVLADVLTELGYRVVVAARLRDPAVAGDPLLLDLAGRRGVTMHDIGDADATATLDTLAATIRRAGAAVTLLTEADTLLPALAERRRAAAPTLAGRVVGLFIRSTNYEYRPRASALRRARTRLGEARHGRVGEAVFHESLVPRRVVLDAALVLDERFALAHARSHQWMPDIFRELGEPSPAGQAETRDWAPRLREFLAAGEGRPLVVYTGPSDHRRGYDTLLRLCVAEQGRFAHCGERDAELERESADVGAARAALAARGDLLETGVPYVSAATADLFLAAARCVALPYRAHDGSSGSMLQAVAAGRPVLVPDRGLSAWRVRSFGLGAVYRDGDDADLARRFRELCRVGPEPYREAAASYTALFGREQVAAAITRAVAVRGDGARLPQQALRDAVVDGTPAKAVAR